MKDLVGQRFHCLTVTAFSHKDVYGKALWICQCDCGKKTTSDTGSLNRGNKKSCGHLRREYLQQFRQSGRPRQPRDESGLELDEGLEELGAWR